MSKNIYDQQLEDFLGKLRLRLAQLTLAQGDCNTECACSWRVIGDLWMALRTLTNCHTTLSYPERLALADAVASRHQLECVAPTTTVQTVTVREAGASTSTGTGGGLSLPLTGEQVTVRIDGVLKPLQTVITDLYGKAAPLYTIDGGGVYPNRHPSIAL